MHIIGGSFGVSDPGKLTWSVAGYSLTVGTFILFSGRLGDVFGYKRMLIIGNSWFALWTLIAGCAVYSNYFLFVFARVLQGIGPAICMPNALAILGSSYPPGKRKAMVFALFGAMAPSGGVLGFLSAGLFALAWWPWTFWSFAMGLAVMTVLFYFVIPDPPRKVRESMPLSAKIRELDVPGAVAGVLALVLFNFAWNQSPISGWGNPTVIVTLVLSVLFAGVFFVIEIRYASNPLIPFQSLTAKVGFVLGVIACGWSSFGIWVVYIWQREQVLKGLTILNVVAYFVPVAIVGLVASVTTGLILHKTGPVVVMSLALLAFTIGSILAATPPLHQIYWGELFVSFLIMPFGMDMSFPAGTLILSDAVSKEHQGVAASLVMTIVNYSISMGLGVAGTVQVHVNDGGKTFKDTEKGIHAAQYAGVGLAGLGLVVCLVALAKDFIWPPGQQNEKN